MLGAMEEFIVEGIRTTLPLQRELLQTEEFAKATFWTRFVDGWVEEHAAAKRGKK